MAMSACPSMQGRTSCTRSRTHPPMHLTCPCSEAAYGLRMLMAPSHHLRPCLQRRKEELRRRLLADIGYAEDLPPQERWGWWWCHVCGTRPGQPPEEAAMPQRGCIGRCLHLYPHTPACRRLVAKALHLTI